MIVVEGRRSFVETFRTSCRVRLIRWTIFFRVDAPTVMSWGWCWNVDKSSLFCPFVNFVCINVRLMLFNSRRHRMIFSFLILDAWRLLKRKAIECWSLITLTVCGGFYEIAPAFTTLYQRTSFLLDDWVRFFALMESSTKEGNWTGLLWKYTKQCRRHLFLS